MAYYNPLSPILDSTRFEIERGINMLEKKLRERKQIDMEIQHLRNEELTRRYELAAYHKDLLRDNSSRHQYQGQRIRQNMQQQQQQLIHFQKMRRLQHEQFQLNSEKFISSKAQYQKLQNSMAEEEELALLKKYQDGTRAKQISYQLNSYHKPEYPIAKQQKEYHSQERRNNYKKEGQKQIKFQINPQQRSPYSKFDSDEKSKELNIFKNQGIRSPQNNEQENNMDILKPKNKNKKMKGSKSYRKINSSRQKYNNNNQSFLKNRSKYSVSKGNKIKYSTIDKNDYVEGSANQKIRNRLKLSEIIFEDSKFRNIKHETSHLDMTFENELKIRKQIKDKINNHPIILKKHAMVV